MDNLLQGIAYARKTADYPEGARFVWNVEVLWAADLYLHRLGAAQRTDFLEAVKHGQVALNGMYLNELTGLCRPEELLRLFRYSTSLAEQTGVPIDSAMISDVPGYTWGTVTAMAQAGIKYFSIAPNYIDRIGDILVKWENQPFYWVSPSGKEKVLVWIPLKGYALSHIVHELLAQVRRRTTCAELEKTGYPYDIAYIRWSGHGDNASPDPAICEFVKAVERQARLAEVRDRLDQRGLPRLRAALRREASAGPRRLDALLGGRRRLVGAGDRAEPRQRRPADARPRPSGPCSTRPAYPAAAFDEAWRNVLLYSEHTWGAYCCDHRAGRPAHPGSVADQTVVRRAGEPPVPRAPGRGAGKADGAPAIRLWPAPISMCSTRSSWPRTELVIVPRGISERGDRVTDDQGRPIAVPAALPAASWHSWSPICRRLAGRRYTLSPGAPDAGARRGRERQGPGQRPAPAQGGSSAPAE